MRTSPDISVNRRLLLQACALAPALSLPALGRALGRNAPTSLFSAIGITAKVGQAAQMKLAGAQFIVESVADFLIPEQADELFEPRRIAARSSALPILGCNSFLRDPTLRCVGPE